MSARVISTPVARDCACWECGTIVRVHETGFRRLTADLVKPFVCRDCAFKEEAPRHAPNE